MVEYREASVILSLCVLYFKDDIMIAKRTGRMLLDNMRSVCKDVFVCIFGGVYAYIQLLCEVSYEFHFMTLLLKD